MNAIGNNWDCEKCGRHMTPHGDCPHCEKIERKRAEAAGEIKRAKNIAVGDVVSPRFSFKVQTFDVHTVEVSPKGKVVINRGEGWLRGENVFQAEQWVDICNPRAILPA